MSFGFGVGDFLAVIELATKIRKRFSDAPAQLQDISYEVKSLSILLSDVAVHADTVVKKLHPSKAEELKTIVNGSNRVLRDLDNLLTKYENVSPGPDAGERHRVKRVWERLMFDPGDVSDLRARLTSNIAMLEAFVTSITQRKTQKSLARLEKHVEGQEQQQILDWVSKDCQRHTDSLNSLVQRREPGTRKWLFESPQWEAWIADEGRGTTLFCPGIPGAGKTHASAMVLERLYSIFPSDSVGIAFAFCDYQRSDDTEHIDLARNLLRMILERSQAWPVELSPLYESSKRSRSEVSLDEVFSLLKISMRPRSRNFVVIDAIDELDADARDALIPKLFELQRFTGLSMFVTSRDIGQIGNLFSGSSQMRIRATDEDIEKYISTHMATLPSFVSNNVDLQNQIKNSVVQAAGEMFLLANLHLRSLKTKSSPKALRKALQNLSCGPDSTKKALENTMQRVINQPEETASTALQTLMILTTARRPLTAIELCNALAIDLEELEDGFHDDNAPPIDYVLSSCAGMVIIETQTRPIGQSGLDNATGSTSQSTEGPAGDSLVKLAHKSIRDYLSSTQSQWFPHAESQMAAICRTFKQASEHGGIQPETPFLDYAVKHWGIHHIEIDSVISVKAPEKEIDVRILRQGSFPLAVKQAGDQFGLRQLALELQELQDLIVLWACQKNSMNILEIFLSLNLDSFLEPMSKAQHPTETDKDCEHAWCPAHGSQRDIYPGCSSSTLAVCAVATYEHRVIDEAFVMAAEFGRQSIAETLLSNGASIAGRVHDGWTALGVAALKGHSAMLSWLLGLDSMEVKRVLDVQGRQLFPEGDPAEKRSIRLPSRLPKSKETRKAKTSRSLPGERTHGQITMTPLAGAAFNGHEDCVRIILEWMRKHCPESATFEWNTVCMNAMLCAMEAGNLAIMRMLLPLVDVNSVAPGFNGYTLLHFAILMEKPEAVKLLSADTSFDPSIAGRNGRTALALAARIGSEDLIQELWACGAAQVDPLAALEALFEGHDAAFMTLCRKAGDCIPGGVFATDDSGYSFFDRILFSCVREITNCKAVRGRQKTCATKIEDIDAHVWTPISEEKATLVPTFYRKSFEKLRTQLIHPDNSPVFGKSGHTDREHCFGTGTLYLALASGSCALLRSLLQLYPAAVCNVDCRGRTILMAAWCRGSQESFEVVLKTIEDQQDTTVVNAVTNNTQDSVLSLAIWGARLGLETRLLSLLSFDGLDLRPVLQEDKSGNYPLMDLAMMAAEHSILPLDIMKSKMAKRPTASGIVLHRNCMKIFNALSANVGPEELSNSLLRVSKSQLTRTGVRIIDILSQMADPGCLETLLLSCPALRSQLHVPDTNGMTSLIHASRSWWSPETVKFLLKAPEVDVGYRDAEGRTALSHVAQNLGQFTDGGLATALVEEHGQDPLAVDNHGWSPLRYAVCNGNVWEASPYHQLLKNAGVPIDWTDTHGSNPLHLAIKGGSPLAIKLLLQHSSSSSWLNAADADGRVPLAYFFSPPRTSRYMCYYRMRYPFSGPLRSVVSIEDSLKHHREAQQAVQMMLDRPDILPDTPDKDSQTPLCHALDSMWKEYSAFFAGFGSPDDGHFHGFLRSSIEALCARDDVNPLLRVPASGKTPLDLATELVRIRKRGKTQRAVAHSDGDTDSASADASGRAKMRAVIKGLTPVTAKDRPVTKAPPPRPSRKR